MPMHQVRYGLKYQCRPLIEEQYIDLRKENADAGSFTNLGQVGKLAWRIR